MILPADNPLYDGPPEEFRARMIEYIRIHFADLLGKDARLLDEPNGLDLIQQKVEMRLSRSGLTAGREQAAA